MSLPIIFKPLSNLRDRFLAHSGDTFRETIDLWEEAGLVEVVLTQNPHVWLGEEETEAGPASDLGGR